MARRQKTEKQHLDAWELFADNIRKATPVDLNESKSEQEQRIQDLENDYESWFRYYFPNFYKSEPAAFHIAATIRVIDNPEWYEVRSWSRELAKSTRTMMEVLYLVMTGSKRNILMVSATEKDAVRLLKPYRIVLEENNRLKHDYGKQRGLRNWKEEEFITRKKVSFRAVGAGQSPRGTKLDEVRPDLILIDDIDTDEMCRNKERVKAQIEWVEDALIPTRSISEPLLIIACGNLIAPYTTISELGKKADIHEIINIIDEDGNSSWPQKNNLDMIERVRSTMSTRAFEKEYMNNPYAVGDVFDEMVYKKCPPLKKCEKVVIYADPATSNRRTKNSSAKVVVVIGLHQMTYYIYKVWIANDTNAWFVDCLYMACKYLDDAGVNQKKVFIENNSLQDPHYEQVLIPLIRSLYKSKKYRIPVRPDKRKKPDKYERIEGTLEPIHRLGNLVMNIDEMENPQMKKLDEQFIGVSENSKDMDGPDAVEGGVWLCENKIVKGGTNYVVGNVPDRSF